MTEKEFKKYLKNNPQPKSFSINLRFPDRVSLSMAIHLLRRELEKWQKDSPEEQEMILTLTLALSDIERQDGFQCAFGYGDGTYSRISIDPTKDLSLTQECVGKK